MSVHLVDGSGIVRKRLPVNAKKATATQHFRLLAFLLFLLPTSSALASTEVSSQESTDSSFTLFESGPVRPLALSPDGSLLFATNTPDARLEIFRVHRHGLTLVGSVPVGLEPVAVAARSQREVWVVNHLSDSVSVVRLDGVDEDSDDDDDSGGASLSGRVVRTLHVGDEPRDIVFAGVDRNLAFITTAHRGQNVPYDPQLTTPGIGRADVWVFDGDQLGDALGGTPTTILHLFADTPRALAVSPDGHRVYAAAFFSGNRTTVLHTQAVAFNGGLPEPRVNFMGVEQPLTSLIVRFDGEHWVDEESRVWDDQVKFFLPDRDVFVIDAESDIPSVVAGSSGSFQGVGTVIFNMVVNPSNGNIYVSNTEARNEVRFEGAGDFLSGFGKKTVRGRAVENRITVLSEGGVAPRRLNKHVDFDALPQPIPNAVNAKSLAIPLEMAITSDGSRLYVAAFGSSKVGVFDTEALENDSFEPSEETQIAVSGGGPAGLVLDEERDRLYVLTRFDNAISIVDLESAREIAHVAMPNPEPEHIVRGRRFLYDASFTSSNGTQACASCHVFGDLDALAWDLGDPDGEAILNNGELRFGGPLVAGLPRDFQAMKGPMTTQSLRGLANHGPMHWRGDRLNNQEPTVQPDGGAFDEVTAFNRFNVAFEGLLGRAEPLTSEQMQAFTDFALEISYPPNPIRHLDNTLTSRQQRGREKFFTGVSDGFSDCNVCHVLDATANAEFGVQKPGFFGTDGAIFTSRFQGMKIPHLRNLYQKIGMFGMPRVGAVLPEFPDRDNAFMGDQIRGFGFFNDGATDTLFRFLGDLGFVERPPGTAGPGDPGNPEGFPISPVGVEERLDMESFLLAFDSNLAPSVGQQITLIGESGEAARQRVELLVERSDAGECDLVARQAARGFLHIGDGRFTPDRQRGVNVSLEILLRLARRPGRELTLTCVPPGSGRRLALDRDLDGVLDGDEAEPAGEDG